MSQDYLLTDFSAGQISPKFRGRFDLEIYKKGLQKCSGFIPTLPCGITYRPGTRRIGEPSTVCNLIPWVVSKDIAYVLEVTQTGIRFWRNNTYTGVAVTFPSSISAADLASIQVAQAPRRLFMVMGTGTWEPKVLTYTGVDAFTFGTMPIVGNTGKVPFQSSGNYPRCLTIHEGRLFYGSSVNEPQKIWASRPGIYYYNPWSSEIDRAVGDLCTAVDGTKLAIFRCTVAGTSGTTEPTWPGSGTVADGTVTWTYYADYWVDFSEFDEISTTTPITRESARAFQGNLTTGSKTITGIDKATLKKMKVGDRIWGPGLPTRAGLTMDSVYTTKNGKSFPSSGGVVAASHVIINVSSYVCSLLRVGEPIMGDNIPQTTIASIGSNQFNIVGTANANDTAATMYVGTIDCIIDSIDMAAGSLTFSAYVTLGSLAPVLLSALSATATSSGAYLASGWHDADTVESENSTVKRQVIEDANAYSFLISSDQCDEILWFSSGRNLVVGTVSGERIIPAGTTALTVQCPKHTSYGSSRIQPVSLGEAVLFVESSGKSIREYLYTQEQDGYYSPPLSIMAEGIFTGSIVKMDYQVSPVPIAWFLQDNGTLVGCVYSKAMGMAAWFSLETAGTIESMCVAPYGSADVLYLEVLRGAVRTVERLLPLETVGEHLDCSVSAVVAAGAVSGLTWLASKAVRVYYAGTVYDLTVSAGGVATMPGGIPNGSTVVIGFGFTGAMTTMPANTFNQAGVRAQKQKTVYSMTARLLQSYAFKAGRAATATLETAAVTGPWDGDYEIPISGDWESDGSITIVQDSPFDLTILAITANVD